MATDLMTTPLTRKAPRISVNKLGEYMTATPLRRRRIILDQQRPKAFIVPRYTEAQDAITKYLLRDKQDENVLLSEIERLGLAPSATEWEAQRKRLCIEALERFLDVASAIDLSGQTPTAGGNDQPRLQVGGLEISVRPEVILRRTTPSGEPACGALKLYFSKTIPLRPEGGQYVSTMVYQFVDTQVEPGQADPQLCQVVDVFGGRVFIAPRATARRKRDLWAACEEIARAWDNQEFHSPKPR
ncbi:MAG: hypothetical protein WD894_21400 [Pirellulales bacterium]